MEPWMVPMLANLPKPGQEFPEEHWAAEGKYDGWRLVVYRDLGGEVHVFGGRNSANYTGQLPYLEAALKEFLPADSCIDGELVSPVEFGHVQSIMRSHGPHHPTQAFPALQLIVFDVLRLVQVDVRRIAWKGRRHMLEMLYEPSAQIRLSPVLPTDDALQVALGAGLEGIVMKRRASMYRPGKTSDWQKIKPQTDFDAVVIGFKDGEHGGQFDGMVGAFEVALIDSEGNRTGVVTTVKCGTVERHREATAHPDLWRDRVIECRCNGFFRDGKPRHPVFNRVRDDRAWMELVA